MTNLILCGVVVFVNIVLWIIFFVRQKKLFSPDRILAEIELEVNKVILSLNHETDKCITLVEGTREGLARLLRDAKRYTELATKDLSTMARSQGIIQSLNNIDEKEKPSRKPLEKNQVVENDNYSLFSAENGHEVLDQIEVSKEAVSMNEKMQKEQVPEKTSKIPEITRAKEQIKIEKNLREKVLELAEEGVPNEEIAKSLDISITEVQLIIDIFA